MSSATFSESSVRRDLTQAFSAGVEDSAPVYPELCSLRESDGADEQYAMLGAMPGMREWLGDRVFKSLRAADFVIKNRLWESSLTIEQTDIEDDRLEMLKDGLSFLGAEAASHPDKLLFELVSNGDTNTGFDGQFFFDTDHSWGESGSQSNDLSASMSGAAPTESEFRIAYHASLLAMRSFKRDNGQPFMRGLDVGLDSLILLVPTELSLVAHEAIDKLLVDGGETNIVLDRPRIISAAYLTDPTKFYTLNVGQKLRPFVFQARRPLRTQVKGLDENEFKDVKFLADARYNIGYAAWWNAVSTTFA